MGADVGFRVGWRVGDGVGIAVLTGAIVFGHVGASVILITYAIGLSGGSTTMYARGEVGTGVIGGVGTGVVGDVVGDGVGDGVGKVGSYVGLGVTISPAFVTSLCRPEISFLIGLSSRSSRWLRTCRCFSRNVVGARVGCKVGNGVGPRVGDADGAAVVGGGGAVGDKVEGGAFIHAGTGAKDHEPPEGVSVLLIMRAM